MRWLVRSVQGISASCRVCRTGRLGCEEGVIHSEDSESAAFHLQKKERAAKCRCNAVYQPGFPAYIIAVRPRVSAYD